MIILDRGRSPVERISPARNMTMTRRRPLRVRYFSSNASIFLGDDYLIKGVAGSILWKLLREYTQSGRNQFTNREIRLDPDILLPAISENLEARLVLLKRRLQERSNDIAIVAVSRGKFRLDVSRPLSLETVEPT
jgi:hypothetical protein